MRLERDCKSYILAHHVFGGAIDGNTCFMITKIFNDGKESKHCCRKHYWLCLKCDIPFRKTKKKGARCSQCFKINKKWRSMQGRLGGLAWTQTRKKGMDISKKCYANIFNRLTKMPSVQYTAITPPPPYSWCAVRACLHHQQEMDGESRSWTWTTQSGVSECGWATLALQSGRSSQQNPGIVCGTHHLVPNVRSATDSMTVHANMAQNVKVSSSLMTRPWTTLISPLC